MIKTVKKSLFALLSCLFLITQAIGQTSEYRVKAVFLEKFSRFIEWPESAKMADTTSAFNLVILGKNPFGEILDQLYRKNKIRKKRVQISYIQSIKEINACHLLFIAKSQKSDLKNILKYTRGRDIVTVSDTPGFGDAGVLINFFMKENKIQFEINYDSVRKSSVQISYLLMELARIIGKKNEFY